MLDVQAVTRFLFKSERSPRVMDDQLTQSKPVERIEAALARIARHVQAPDPVATEVAARLDSLITQLRSALDE